MAIRVDQKGNTFNGNSLAKKRLRLVLLHPYQLTRFDRRRDSRSKSRNTLAAADGSFRGPGNCWTHDFAASQVVLRFGENIVKFF